MNISADPRYRQGIERFNRAEFYDAHDVWEEVWRELEGEPRNFIQGLIQFATALHHFKAGNYKGSKILYEGGMTLLAAIPDRFEGIEVGQLKGAMTRCLASVLPVSVEDLPGRYNPHKSQAAPVVGRQPMPHIELCL